MRRMRHVKPREIQGCQAAYDFSQPGTLFDSVSGGSPVSAGGAIARVEDVSGNARHVAQSDPARRPTRSVSIGGQDAGFFNGSRTLGSIPPGGHDVLRNVGRGFLYSVSYFSGVSDSSNRILLSVSSGASPNASRAAIFNSLNGNVAAAGGRRLDSDSLQSAIGSSQISSVKEITSGYFEWTEARVTMRRNGMTATVSGSFQTPGNTSDTNVVGIGVGSTSDGGGLWQGAIGEGAVFQGALTESQIRRIEHSRMRKWRISS